MTVAPHAHRAGLVAAVLLGLAARGCLWNWNGMDPRYRDAGLDEPSDVPDDAPTDMPDAAAPDTEAGPAPPDYCARLPMLRAGTGAPMVQDGVVDDALPLQQLAPSFANWTSGSGAPPPDGTVVQFAAAWSPLGIYFYLSINRVMRTPAPLVDGGDTFPYCGDAAELFVDHDGVLPMARLDGDVPDYDPMGTAQLVVVAPAMGTSETSNRSSIRYSRLGAFASWTGSRLARASFNGYVVEAFVTAADLHVPGYAWSAGQHVGLNLGTDIGRSPALMQQCGARLGQFFLYVVSAGGACGAPSCDPTAFCRPVLSE